MKIAVLGGGIQGVCVALALAERPNREIHIIDRHSNLLQGTSLIGEGKIHLGLVYAKDPSLTTAKKLLLDALSFAPLLEKYINRAIPWKSMVSNPFDYVIAEDSMLTFSEHQNYYQAVNDLYNLYRQDPNLHYLGYSQKDIIDLPLKEISNYKGISHQIGTRERAINMELLRSLLVESVLHQGILAKTKSDVLNIEERQGLYLVKYKMGSQIHTGNYDKVVNCLWDGRLQLDAQMDRLPVHPWLFRLKYRMLVKNPDPSYNKSFTMVQGKYGDVVSFPKKDLLYLSWYPTCCQKMTNKSQIPPDWLKQMNQSQPNLANEIGRDTIKNLSPLLPKINLDDIQDIRAGVIYARGNSDIDDPGSELHHRCEDPISSKNGYFSVNTGKLTSAPRNASILATMIS